MSEIFATHFSLTDTVPLQTNYKIQIFPILSVNSSQAELQNSQLKLCVGQNADDICIQKEMDDIIHHAGTSRLLPPPPIHMHMLAYMHEHEHEL